jgi:carboxyl-terminal processing protease
MRIAAAIVRGAVCLFLAVLFVVSAHAEKRVALVIGNSAYRHVGPLTNPANDAPAMAALFRTAGFDVVEQRSDLGIADMRRAVSNFADSAQDSDVAVIFYAGHGIEVDGVNYLIPVDATLTRDFDVEDEAVSLDRALKAIEPARRLRLVILDSCRSNPFVAKMRRSSRAIGRGLAPVEPARSDTLVAFAAKGGSTADDGDQGGHSPFTSALLQHLATPGLDVGFALRRVRDTVMASTSPRQEPFVYGSLGGQTVAIVGTPSESHPQGAPADPAAQAWAVTQNTNSIAVLEDFIRHFGDSFYASLARARIEELRRNQSAPQAVIAPPVNPPPPAQKLFPRPSRDDVVKQFGMFNNILGHVQTHYVEKPDDGGVIAGAVRGVMKEFPDAKEYAAAGLPQLFASSSGPARAGLEDLYGLAGSILEHQAADEGRLARAAIDGMLSALDPHSSYMDAKSFQDMQVQTRGEFGGLGMEVNMEDGLVKVVSPIDDTPAAKAGIRAGDSITHIDDNPVQGLTLNQAVEKMRGPANTKVRLRIVRKGNDAPIEIALVREIIRVRSVRSKIEDDVGIVRITQFNEQTSDNLKKAIADISAQAPGNKLRGYVIDLRNNPGGLLDQAIAVSDAFLERGEIVSTRGRNPEETQRYNAKPGDLAKGKPVIVLINGGSASASEIVAGALQDHRRATLVGTRSFGKGSVQTIIPLGANNGALRLTTARYYTPSGRSIQARGIAPDIEVLQDVPMELKPDQTETKGESSLPGHLKAQGGQQSDEHGGSQSYVPKDEKDDKALRMALDLLRGAVTNPGFPPNPKSPTQPK